jgi:hypothetical protein
VPLDLETITLRAMAKSRDERYSTAQQFADDLRLFLEGKPTVARRPTLLDRAAKWALRHRRAVTLGAACLLVLAVVSATATVMIARAKVRADDALADAKVSLAKAKSFHEQAQEVVDRFGSGLASDPAAVPGIEDLRRRVLGRRCLLPPADRPNGRRSGRSATCRRVVQSGGAASSLGDNREATILPAGDQNVRRGAQSPDDDTRTGPPNAV